MLTVLYDKETGIVRGFDNPTINLQETNKIILPMVAELEPVKRAREIDAQLKAAYKEQATNTGKLKAFNRDLRSKKRNHKKYAELMLQREELKFRIEVLKQELPPGAQEVPRIKQRMIKENAVYHQPGPGESLISDELAREAAMHIAQGLQVKITEKALDGVVKYEIIEPAEEPEQSEQEEINE